MHYGRIIPSYMEDEPKVSTLNFFKKICWQIKTSWKLALRCFCTSCCLDLGVKYFAIIENFNVESLNVDKSIRHWRSMWTLTVRSRFQLTSTKHLCLELPVYMYMCAYCCVCAYDKLGSQPHHGSMTTTLQTFKSCSWQYSLFTLESQPKSPI